MPGKCEIDHIARLCNGGQDSTANVDTKFMTWHSAKSKIGRLGEMHRNPSESYLSTIVLEGFFDRPELQQLVGDDEAGDHIEVDIVKCRSIALICNRRPL